MEKHLYFDKIPEEFRNKYLNSGYMGSCYKMENENFVYKEFRENISYKSQYETLLNFNSDIFIFPETLIYLKTSETGYDLSGYLMKYIEGVDLIDLPSCANINNLLNQLKNIENEIKKLSLEGINMCDISTCNMIYSKDNEIKVIDTDLYDLCMNDIFENLYDNMLYYASALICLFRGAEEVSKKLTSLNKEYNLCVCEGRFLFSKYLINLVDYLQEQSKKDIKTYGDVKESIELVRKR